MSVFVVDAGVVIKWFVPEIHGDAARRLLAAAHQYLSPEALAVRLKTALITADDRLGRLVAAHPMTAAHVRLIKTFE